MILGNIAFKKKVEQILLEVCTLKGLKSEKTYHSEFAWFSRRLLLKLGQLFELTTNNPTEAIILKVISWKGSDSTKKQC